jgi:hypothetical protein
LCLTAGIAHSCRLAFSPTQTRGDSLSVKLSVLGSAFAIVEFLVYGVLGDELVLWVLAVCIVFFLEWFMVCFSRLVFCMQLVHTVLLFESHFTGALLPPFFVCSVALFWLAWHLLYFPTQLSGARKSYLF